MHPVFEQLDDVEALVALWRECQNAERDACDAFSEEPSLVEDELANFEAKIADLHSRLFGPEGEPPPSPRPGPIPQVVDESEPWRALRPAWRIASLDREHPLPWVGFDENVLETLIANLRTFEDMTWEEIEAMPHSHPWPSIDSWVLASRKRIEELEYDDQDNWYQLQCDRMARIYGFRSGHVLHVVWWDRHHDVYKTGG